jgi:hypothetical protein
MKLKPVMIFCLLVMLLLPTMGCKENVPEILGIHNKDEQVELIRVKIYFTDGQNLEAYIKDLGIDQEGKVYVGGSSLNYLYDKQGNIIGSYNYNRVLYIKIIPETDNQ